MLLEFSDDTSLIACLQAQVMFYIIMTVLEDVETQRRGTVMVLMNLGPNRLIESIDFVRKMSAYRKTLLDRVVGAHHCHDSKIMRPFLSVGIRLIRVQMRARFRPHFGTLTTASIGSRL